MITLEKIDERDTMFARAHYKKDSQVYKDYYAKNPDKKRILTIALELEQNFSGEDSIHIIN